MFSRLLNAQIKHPWMFFIIFVLILGLFGYYATQLQINPALEDLIAKDSEFNTNARVITNALGQRDGLTIFIKSDRESTLSFRTSQLPNTTDLYIQQINDVLAESQYVEQIGIPEYADDNTAVRIPVTVRTPETNAGYSQVQAELNMLIAQAGQPPGVTTTLSGFPLLLERIIILLVSDSLTTMLITIIMLSIIVFFYFRNIPLSVITLVPPVCAVILLAGLMALLNIHITVTLAAIGVFMLGLGIDYGIHICVHYQDHRKEGKKPIPALIETFNELKIAITASFLTTFSGFLALILGVSPSSQSQGQVLALGIVAIYLVSFLMVPVLLRIFGNNIQVRHSQFFDNIVEALVKLAVVQSKYPKLVLTAIGILTVVFFFGMTQVQFSTSNSNWIPEDDEVSLGFREISWTFSDDDTMLVLIESNQGDLRHPLVAKDVQRIAAQFASLSMVQEVSTAYDNINLSFEEVHQATTPLKYQWFNKDYTLTFIRIQSENFGTDEAGNSVVVQEARDILARETVYHADISLFGDVVRFDELSASLQADASQTTLIGMLLVFVVASSAYASIVVGFTALLPIIVAIIWAVGMMGFFGVPFTNLSTGIVSLVLGIGADFSIHLVDGINRYTNAGMEISDAIKKTLRSTGGAILLSSTTTLMGFLALTLATLAGIQRLGLSLAFAMIAAFFVAVAMVPAIMSLYLRRKKK